MKKYIEEYCMNLEIGTRVFNTQIGMPGYVTNLSKRTISIMFRKYALLRDKRQIRIGTYGEYIFNYPESFESGELVLYREDMISSLYDTVCFVIGKSQTVVKCKGWDLKQWTKIGDWKVNNLNEQIVVFPFEFRILLDQTVSRIAFTAKDNFMKIGTEEFDLHKICRIGKVTNFHQARQLISNFLGYKKENIFEMDNDTEKIYTRLGINDLH